MTDFHLAMIQFQGPGIVQAYWDTLMWQNHQPKLTL